MNQPSTEIELGPILQRIKQGDPVGAAYRLSQLIGEGEDGRPFYEAGREALQFREELGKDALRFARLVFAEAVERDPDFGDAHHDLATAMRELGMYDDAVKHYARALELMPNDLDSLLGTAAAHADAGRLDDAATALAYTIQVHPDSGHAQANLGIVLEAAGRDLEAVGAYARAVARFDAALLEASDDEEAMLEALARRRWARIQHAAVLERLDHWPQAIAVLRHLHEEEQAIAASESDDHDDEDTGTDSVSSEESAAEDGEQVLVEPNRNDRFDSARRHPSHRTPSWLISGPTPDSDDSRTRKGPGGSEHSSSDDPPSQPSDSPGHPPSGLQDDSPDDLPLDRTASPPDAGNPESARGPDSAARATPPDARPGPCDDGESESEEETEAGRLGLERVFSRLVQLCRLDLAYLVLDQLGGELADERTRATYTIYDPENGIPVIMVEHWDGGKRERLEP
ncbi:MAG: tetratricopeptide repeat protein [Pseudomonadota bacterium]